METEGVGTEITIDFYSQRKCKNDQNAILDPNKSNPFLNDKSTLV